MKKTIIPAFALSLLLAACLPAAEPTAEQIEFFEKKIRPVLVSKCYKCHSAKSKELKGGLLLDTREGIRRGGETGHAVVPGNFDESLILSSIRYDELEMPPDEQLPDNVVKDFERWIKMGAPDPRDGKSAPIRRTINFEKAREFWSFQPIGNHKPPKTSDPTWPSNEIDHFVLARLEAKDIRPVLDAEPRVLVRRLYFDLIGLPPTPEQVEEFVADPSAAALESLVDRLLESQQFGERWGRHWMDIVRYAESTGMERNYTFPQAWRYRDYVINAFNSDKPFDQFIKEQVAGDLLPSDDKKQRDEQLIATGMLAMGPKSLNERNKEKFAMDIVDEQIDVISRAFLGLTASCARCHDHKFDPIPQKEYYQLAGIFRSTNTFYGTGGGRGNRQGGQLIALRPDSLTPVRVAGNAGGKKNSAKRLKGQLRGAEKRLAQLKKKNVNQKQIKRTEAQIKRLRAQLKKQKAPEAAPKQSNDELVMAVLDASNPGDTQIRLRGEANDRGDRVPRGFLTIATLADAPQVGDAGSGRAELAEWLTQKDNPLTARVAANRVWQHLFGRGIVGTVNNFGANGDRPSHPELLDSLAQRLVDNRWSVKQLIKFIVTSHVYRLSSSSNAVAEQADPQNRLLWRMNQRRLEGEAIRDAILMASGQIDLTPGEKSIVTKIGDGDIGRGINPSRFKVNNTKRSVYLPIVRGAVPEMLRVFDFPEPSIIAGQRDVTTVPTQALYMMNSPFVVEQSQQMAKRILAKQQLDDSDRINLAYQLALCRPASADEISRSLEFIEQATAAANGGESEDESESAWAGFCQVLFASGEFRYVE